MNEKFSVIDVTSLSPRDNLLRAAKAALHDHHNYSHYEQSEQVMDDLREAIRRVELEPGEGGWIVWNGGPSPVEPDAIVDISRACGIIETNVVAGHYSWGHHAASADRDITSFRLVNGEWRKS
jgi:hypothetical protein